jgi:hypothetical protein
LLQDTVKPSEEERGTSGREQAPPETNVIGGVKEEEKEAESQTCIEVREFVLFHLISSPVCANAGR